MRHIICSDYLEDAHRASFHPPHLDDSLGRLLPKSLIPLCSYQGTILGKNVKRLNFTACRGFRPSLTNGQLCYSLNLSQAVNSESKSGVKNGLTIVLDQPTSFELTRTEKSEATIHLETLAGFSDSRPGKYFMSALKKITGADAFMSLSDSEKGCQPESFEECNMRQVFAELQRECKCIPWSLRNFQKVGTILSGKEPICHRMFLSAVQQKRLVWQPLCRETMAVLSSALDSMLMFGIQRQTT